MRRDVAYAGGDGLEDGVEVLDCGFGAADHHAVAALESPDAAAGAYVDVVDTFGGEVFGAADVVDVVGVAAVDEDVAGFEMRGELGDGVLDDASGNHQPDGAGFGELAEQVLR